MVHFTIDFLITNTTVQALLKSNSMFDIINKRVEYCYLIRYLVEECLYDKQDIRHVVREQIKGYYDN